MPNPLELLKKAGTWATTPLVKPQMVQPAQDAIDSPSLDRSPGMARLQGFGAGALGGLAGMTSPMDIAGMAAGPALGALKNLGRGAQAASRMAPTLDVVEPNVVRQVAPALDDVDSLIGDMRRNLARVPNSRAQAPHMETLGERAAEFTPVGGEGMYNAGRSMNQGSDAMESLYQHLMRTMGGRGR